MEVKQQAFKGLVNEARLGKLRLPEFQRDWKWNRRQVIRLFDSIRKNYPIGGFLTLEATEQLNLSPRLLSGIESADDPIESYVLDGQQRMTAGLALYYGKGNSHYFLNLNSLWEAASSVGLDYDNPTALREFADSQDDDGGYLKARREAVSPESLLPSGLFWTPYLTDEFEFSRAKERYLSSFPERGQFMERLVAPYFKLGPEPIVTVTQLDASMPVEAITRVFETLNTSGQRLTPVEIVVALLFAQNIRLRGDLDEFHELTDYYCNMEGTGELFLQVVALLDNKVPQKAALPKTITHVNYTRFRNQAIDHLEKAGEFLSQRFGISLKATNRFVPYLAMLPPLGIALHQLDIEHVNPSPQKAYWLRQLERWFVGSVLEQRYSEAQPTTQRGDTETLTNWIKYRNDFAPNWLKDVRVRRLDRVAPSSAIGKLILCLISRRNPKDPLNDVSVGGNGQELAGAQLHHIFPSKFCIDHISDWNPKTNDADVALNIMPVTKETNQRWSKMNPLDQVADIRSAKPSGWLNAYEPFFLDAAILETMEKPVKLAADYDSYIAQRGKLIQDYVCSEWDFIADSEQIEDEDQDTTEAS